MNSYCAICNCIVITNDEDYKYVNVIDSTIYHLDCYEQHFKSCLRCQEKIEADPSPNNNSYHYDCFLIEDSNDRICIKCRSNPVFTHCQDLTNLCERCNELEYGYYCRQCN